MKKAAKKSEKSNTYIPLIEAHFSTRNEITQKMIVTQSKHQRERLMSENGGEK